MAGHKSYKNAGRGNVRAPQTYNIIIPSLNQTKMKIMSTNIKDTNIKFLYDGLRSFLELQCCRRQFPKLIFIIPNGALAMCSPEGGSRSLDDFQASQN